MEYELTEEGDRLRPVVGVMRESGLWLKQSGKPLMADDQDSQARSLLGPSGNLSSGSFNRNNIYRPIIEHFICCYNYLISNIFI
jgi:hypothetical protein